MDNSTKIDTKKSLDTKTRKNNLLAALEKSLGIVTTACKTTGINRQTFYNWKNDDPEFARAVQDIENISLDFAESKLHELINDGNCSATIFYLKTKGKDRGYIERVENINSQKDPFADMTDQEIKGRLKELRAKRDN